MLYGYARISTPKQSIERQIRNIYAYAKGADVKIITEVFTGTKFDGRQEFKKLLSKVKSGDAIIFDSVSRMSRNAAEGFELYHQLYQKGIDLVFIKEPHINTDTYKKALTNNISMTGTKTDIILKAINEYLMELAKEQIVIAFEQSEKEVTDLRQRTREGIETARLDGKQIGAVKGSTLHIKKKKPILQIIIDKSKDFKGSNTDTEVIAIINATSYTTDKGETKVYHISKNTYYKYKGELKAAI